MLPIERQKRIKEWVKSKQFIKISQLSSDLGVSEMTIHRDIKPLVEEGIIAKTFGGIAYVKNHVAVEFNEFNLCIYCSRTVNERLAYRIIYTDDNIENACCAHCGLLRHQQLRDQIFQAICHDFLSQTTISAVLASYVMETSVRISCCQPQVLTFEKREHAEKFVKGFGGNVFSFHEALKAIHEKMGENVSTCCHTISERR